MAIHPLAGQLAPASVLIDVPRWSRLITRTGPIRAIRASASPSAPAGTGARRSTTRSPRPTSWRSPGRSATTAAPTGSTARSSSARTRTPCPTPAQRTALEVLAAEGVETILQRDDGVTPTPVISHAILVYNRGRTEHKGDGIVITPSHNPPADGGFKYNPPNGGPADTDVTSWIQDRANALLRAGNAEVKRVPFAQAIRADTTYEVDFVTPYVADLASVIDMEAIREAGLKLGVDPLGGAAVHYWQPIADTYGLDITVTNPAVDPTFRFMTLDHDGQIRMDCSSPYAMASLVKLKDRFDLAFGNDPDSDRHGIVTKSAGLMNPNHYLAVAIRYLLTHRPDWSAARQGRQDAGQQQPDRPRREGLGRTLAEVPVGFKWFAPGLLDGSFCFGGEESAGASFLRRDGTVWTTDKDGPILDLLAAEILARTGKDPGEHYRELTAQYRHAVTIRGSMPRRPPSRRPGFRSSTHPTSRRPTWPASRSPPS